MTSPQAAFPLLLTGELDPDVSRWQWLVKWPLASSTSMPRSGSRSIAGHATALALEERCSCLI